MNELKLKPEYAKNPPIAAAIMRIYQAAVKTDERLNLLLKTSMPWHYKATNAAPPPGEIVPGAHAAQLDAPVAAWKVPAAQELQTEAPVAAA